MNDTEINMVCPKCGAVVDLDLTRCPACGLDFYPEEKSGELEPEAPENKTGWLNVFVAVLAGIFISTLIAFILNFIAAQFYPASQVTGIGSFILFAAGPLGAVSGGFVAASLAHERPFLPAFCVSFLTIPVVVLLNTRWQSTVFTANSITAWITILLAGPAGAFLQTRLKHGIKWPGWNKNGEAALYQDLLVKSRFDNDRADRLIAYEKRRNPHGNRLELIQSAIDRWERDNR